MVFQTAPPQPASNARCICAPELVGGAEASQKGLGERIPAKFVLRSAMIYQPLVDRTSGELTILHRHDRRSRPACANTIASGKNPRRTTFKIGIDADKTSIGFQIETRSQRQFVLADSFNDLVSGQ